MNKVDKRKVRRDVMALADIVYFLKMAEKRNHWDFNLYMIDSERKKAEELRTVLLKQLICDHENTEEVETVNEHTGVHDFEVVCKTCKFVLDSY